MQFQQGGEIQIANVSCNQPEHTGEFIKALCLSPVCKEGCCMCSHCLIRNHISCRNQVVTVGDIAKLLLELRRLSTDILALQANINCQFKELLSKIEQTLLPITKYQDNPNFTNLNGLGCLLRKLPKQQIQKSVDEMKIQIKSILDSSRCISNLNSSKIQIIKVNKQPVPQVQQTQMQDQIWALYQKGEELFKKDNYIEAITYFDKVIQIDSKNSDSQFYKGKSLLNLNKYDEAIQQFDSAITIKADSANYWNAKGEALLQIDKIEESIKCFEEVVKIDDNYSAKDNLERVRLMLQNRK